MDEVQSWWEVPAIAHFCYVFRAAFNLFYIEIGELEAAILNIQDPEMCMSLEQLIIRLLQGCYEENEVTSNNWEEKLHELFSDNCEDDENPLENNAFAFLSPRSKVEVLLKLCEFRLDADGALEAIKEIPSEDMQANCIGKDSQNNLYWYFCDERLYKEDPSVPAKKSGKSEKQQTGKGKNAKNSNVKKPTRERKSKPDDSNKSWSIVCHNLSDWEALVKSFSKSKHKQEKELAKEIKEKFLPLLAEVVAEKDRLLRKRFLDLAPKRVSQRLSKVQAQKKMEEQMIAEANEKRRIEMEQEQIKKEAEKKKQEKEDRRKRAEAREKKIHERTLRAQQRDLMRGADVDFSSDEDNKRTNRRSRNAQKQTPSDNENEESSEEASDDDEQQQQEEEEEDASQSESENEQSAKRHSSNSESEISDSDEESKNSASLRKVYSSNGSAVSPNRAEPNSFGRSSVIQNSYGVSKWNVQGDSQGQKIHILRYAYDGSPSNKRLKTNESSYSIGPVTAATSNEPRPNYYNENHAYHPLLHRNLNSCSKVTSTPQVIRIDFIKPPKPQASR